MVRSSILLACSLALAATAGDAQAANPKVAVLAASSSTGGDVQAKIKATNAFSAVDLITVSSSTPTLAQLKAYDAVAVYSYIGFDDPVAMGDVLASYIEAGGGVVLFSYEALATSSWGSGYDIQGRYAKEYALMTPQDEADVESDPVTLGTINEPSSPLVQGVKTFVCGNKANFDDCHHLSSAVQHGGIVVAQFSDGKPLIVRGNVKGHRTVELNFFPVSLDNSLGEWDAKSDGAVIMKNALQFVAGGAGAGGIYPAPGSLGFGDQPVGVPSAPQMTTLTNSGTTAATITGLTVTGANAADFQITPPPSLPITLASTDKTVLSIVFSPTGTGARTATLEGTVQGQTDKILVSLGGNGKGTIMDVYPNPLNLGGTTLNQEIVGKFTIADNGTMANTVDAINLAGDSEFTITPAMSPPFTLQTGASMDVAVRFRSATMGNKTATVTVKSATGDKTVTLQASAGDSAAQLTTTGPVAFTPQAVGTTSPPTSVGVKNTGYSNLTITGVQITGADAADFASATKLPITVAPGAIGSFDVTYKASKVGTSNAQINVATNAPAVGTMLTVPVSGTGVAWAYAITPTTLDFGSVKGGSSATKSVTITNNSTAPLPISALVITGANMAMFSLPSPMPFTIPAKGSKNVAVDFRPTVAGALTATLQIKLADPKTPMVNVALRGTGLTSKLGFTPTTLAFGAVGLGSVSMPMTVTMTNTGNGNVTVSRFSISGTDYSSFDFDTKPTTPLVIKPGDKPTFTVIFKPTKTGSRTAKAQITSDDPLMPTAEITLTGSGAQAGISVSPGDVEFPATLVGTISETLVVTIKNTGAAALDIKSIDTGDEVFTLNAAPTTVPKGGSADVEIVFKPTMAKVYKSEMTITPTDTTLEPETVNLKGTGVDAAIAIAPMVIEWPLTNVGKKGAARQLTITNTGEVETEISSIISSDAKVFVLEGADTPRVLAGGEAAELSVAFVPKADGVITGTIKIFLRGKSTPSAIATLRGEAQTVTKKDDGGCRVARSASPVGPAFALLGLALLGLALRRRSR